MPAMEKASRPPCNRLLAKPPMPPWSPIHIPHVDKTFGMKNKSKSAKVQQYVKQLEASMKPSVKEQRLAQPSVRDKKAAEEAKQKELNDLFAVAIKQPKVPAGEGESGVGGISGISVAREGCVPNNKK